MNVQSKISLASVRSYQYISELTGYLMSDQRANGNRANREPAKPSIEYTSSMKAP